MTKKTRRKWFEPAPQPPRKIGEVHVLDNVTGADFERDEAGRIRLGVAGLSEPKRSLFLKAHLAWIDWEIGRSYRRARWSVPVEEVSGQVDWKAVWEQADLTDSQRIAMDLVILEGYSMSQVAFVEGVSKAAIQDRLNLARVKIRVTFGVLSLDRGLAARVN